MPHESDSSTEHGEDGNFTKMAFDKFISTPIARPRLLLAHVLGLSQNLPFLFLFYELRNVDTYLDDTAAGSDGRTRV